MSHEEEEQRVIEDWRDALENLSTNARHEIISLTSIARDYTSYAYGISESLEEHIKKVGALGQIATSSSRGQAGLQSLLSDALFHQRKECR